jgi:hypothetical protein
VVRLALLVLNVDKEFNTLCLDEIAKEEEDNYCNNCHCHIGSRSNYLLCYGTRECLEVKEYNKGSRVQN